MKGVSLYFLSILLTPVFPVWAEPVRIIKSQSASFELSQIVDGLGIPWGMTFLSDSKIMITERGGYIRLVDIETRKWKELKGVPDVLADGQGGMLDVAVPPDYKAGGWIYFTFVRDKDDSGVTVLARAKLQGDQLIGWQDLLETKSATETGRHFGSRITFDDSGHVYFGVGDRGVRPTAQDLSSHNGTIMRLKLDGQVPKDNPYINKKQALPEIWSYGHRNPQGIVYDRKKHRLWVIEHGPRGGDEINLVLPGRNYGWPVISYGKEYWGPLMVGEGTKRKGMEQPVKQYTPSIAPGSLLLYTGNAFPNWSGNLFSGALKLRHINRVIIDDKGQAIGEERLLEDMDERIRGLAQSSQGWIYFTTDSGKLYSIKPVKK